MDNADKMMNIRLPNKYCMYMFSLWILIPHVAQEAEPASP